VRASGLSSSSPLLASLRPASLSSFDEVVPDQWRRGTIIRCHGVTRKAWWERRAAVLADDTRSSRTGREGFWARQEALSAKDRLLCPCAYSPALRCLNAVTERLPAHGQQGEAGDLLVVSTANTPRPVWPGGCSA
jgi:hypothetical protein